MADTPSLLTLPNELLEEILMNMPDLQSIHSASQTCRRVYQLYQTSQLKIIRSIIHRIHHLQSECKIYQLLRILQFVIQQKMVQRENALAVLQDGWRLFATKQREQLLIPFGKALACSYKLDSDRIQLLQRIWDQDDPFHLEKPEHIWSLRPLTLLPVKKLLDQLHWMNSNRSLPIAALEESQGKFQEFKENVPIAEIRPGEVKWSVDMRQLTETQQIELAENGILFENGLIIIKFSPPTSFVDYDPMRYQRYRYGGGFTQPPNSALRTAILAHRPMFSQNFLTKYQYEGER